MALAPGHRNLFEAPIASRNLMRAHGAAVQRYRSVGANQIGLVVNLEPNSPASDDAADHAAVRRSHAYMNQQYLDPAYGLGCPASWRDVRPRLDRLERGGSGAGRSADRLARRQL